jgi:hypothetical protein
MLAVPCGALLLQEVPGSRLEPAQGPVGCWQPQAVLATSGDQCRCARCVAGCQAVKPFDIGCSRHCQWVALLSNLLHCISTALSGWSVCALLVQTNMPMIEAATRVEKMLEQKQVPAQPAFG